MKILKNSTYDDLLNQIRNLEAKEIALRKSNTQLKLDLITRDTSIDIARELLRVADKELSTLRPKAEKYDKEVARLNLKNQIARVKKMSAKQIAEKYLGMSIIFYDETPAIICGYTDINAIICACNHEEKSWPNKIEIGSDVILQEHERYVYFSSYEVALQIINHLKNQK